MIISGYLESKHYVLGGWGGKSKTSFIAKREAARRSNDYLRKQGAET